MGMESLGGLALHKILSKLGPKETAIVGCVSHKFQEWASDDSLWSQFCAQDLDLSSPQDPFGNLAPCFKAAYQAWRESFGMYPWPLVLRVKRCWGRIKSWLVVNFPEAVTTLRKGATEDELNTLEKSMKVKLPSPTRVLYRFCNGQDQDCGGFGGSFSGSPLGLIGGYSFYDHLVNVCLLPLDQVISLTNAICEHLFPSARAEYLVVAASTTESEKYFFLNCSNGQLYVGTRNLFMDREMIPCVPDAMIHSIHDAGDCQQQDALLLWLEEHIRRLESGMIKVREENNSRSINLFPEEAPLCSTAVTNGVQHPLLHPGKKEFVYQSCSAQRLSQGSIEGSFTFVPGRLTDQKGAEFEVEVPQFFLQYPDYIF